MCAPDYFTVRDVKNPFMAASQPIDLRRAREQWTALRDTFASHGIETLTIDPVEDLEDMVFAANQVFVGRCASGPFAIPSRMRYASRQREVPYFAAWFQRNGFAVVDLALDGDGEFLEGHGDLLWHPGRAHVWAGYGFRSSQAGVAKCAGVIAEYGIYVTPLQLVDETFYHLDTCFAPLSEDAALVYAPALAADSCQRLRAGWNRLHEVSRDDALGFACNGVAVDGGYILPHVSGALETVLKRESLRPIVVDTSEFEKAGGSVFCLKNFLEPG